LSIKQIILPFVGVKGGLMPALHAVQKEFGYLSKESIKTLAKSFNISDLPILCMIVYFCKNKNEKTFYFISDFWFIYSKLENKK